MSPVIEEFAALVAPEIADEKIDLLRAALTFARPEYPGLDESRYLGLIDEYADRVRSRRGESEDPAHTIASINVVLFQQEGFAGNQSEFYDPRNSYLNDVLDRKLGIPISLSVIYMEVAQRVGLPVFGVG